MPFHLLFFTIHVSPNCFSLYERVGGGGVEDVKRTDDATWRTIIIAPFFFKEFVCFDGLG